MPRERTTRRRFLETASLAGLGALASTCSTREVRPALALKRRAASNRPFAPVEVSPEREIRTVVGLRPYRPSGFRVERQAMGRKTVVHNYGHGGGGISLSWGSSHLAVDALLEEGSAPSRVAVLGCGILGLTTARLLQRRGIEVTIYAKDLPPHTTSNIAAGQWSPFTVADFDKRTPAYNAQFDRAARLAHRYFQDMVGSHYGVHWIENYALSNRPFGDGGEGELSDLYPESEVLEGSEHPFPTTYARRFVTMLIEPATFLEALLRDVRIAGAAIQVRAFDAAAEIFSLPEPAIVNCTGLGAKALFEDDELTPIKGQLTFLLPQPEVDYITLAGALYMMPREDGVLLGGTQERGEWSLDVNEEAKARILAGHEEFFRRMKTKLA